MRDRISRSEARKAYWESKTPEERKAHARKMALARAKKMTPEQRTAHAKMMLASRYGKK